MATGNYSSSASQGTSSSSSTSTPIPVFTPQSSWELELSQILGALGQYQYNWAQTQFNAAAAVTDQQINNYLQAAGYGMGMASNLLGRYTSVFEPLENQYIQEAGSYASADRINFNMGQAESASEQATQQGLVNAEQQLQSYGIDPSSGRYADLLAASETQGAAAAAGAGQEAEINTQNTGRQMLLNSVELGQQVPGETVNALNSAYQGIAGAENSMLGLENTGVALTDSASPYYSSAMQLKYPPTGNQSQSTSGNLQRSASASSPSQNQQSGNQNTGQRQQTNTGGYNQGSVAPAYDLGTNKTGTAATDPNASHEIAGQQPGNQNGQYGGYAGQYGQASGEADTSAAAQAGVLPNLTIGGVQDALNNYTGTPGAADTSGAAQSGQLQPLTLGGVNASVLGVDPSQMPPDYQGPSPSTTTGVNPSGTGAIPSPSDNTGGLGQGYVDNSPSNGLGSFLGQLNPVGSANAADNPDQTGGIDQQYVDQSDQTNNYNTTENNDQNFTNNGNYGSANQQVQSDFNQFNQQGNYQPQQSSGNYGNAGGGDGGGGYYAARGGVIPQPRHGRGMTTGGFVPKNLSQSGGRNTDDIPARLNAEEFVMPRDVTKWYGQKFFQDLIAKARKARLGAPAKPTQKPMPNGGGQPRFVSRHIPGQALLQQHARKAAPGMQRSQQSMGAR